MGKPRTNCYSRRVPTNSIVAVALCYCFLWVGHLPSSSRSFTRDTSTTTGSIGAVTAFQQQSPIGRRNPPGAALLATTQPSSPDPDERSSSSLVTQSQSSQVLLSAFANLDLSDQYDAVLSSACAKILDEPAASKDQVVLKLNDCQRLLQEMNDAKVAASPRSMMALVDSVVKTQNAQIMASFLSQCLRNPRGIVQYGSRQADLRLLPSTATSKVRCPDGKIKSARERLNSVPDVPVDERASEVTAALLFAATVVSCETTNLLGMSDVSPAANLVLAIVLGVVAIDNFYDIIKTGSQFLVQQIGNSQNITKTPPTLNLPDKADLPAGLGSGEATGRIVRGLTRLWAVDTEREAACEAAALYTAYVLGLPCFAFRPNAYEAALLVRESVEPSTAAEESDSSTSTTTTVAMDSLLNDSGLLRMLIWLLAPVAMESASHAQLLMSDPREASGFLTRLEEHFGPDDERLIWNHSDSNGNALDKNDLLKWAYAEADCLLRDSKAEVQEIANRLSGGAATVGDCVAVIENW